MPLGSATDTSRNSPDGIKDSLVICAFSCCQTTRERFSNSLVLVKKGLLINKEMITRPINPLHNRMFLPRLVRRARRISISMFLFTLFLPYLGGNQYPREDNASGRLHTICSV